MEGIDKMDNFEQRDDIFSKTIRAGKRTYFFDVKATRRNDYYLTITESKKRYEENGKFFFEKHKLFLYKEDFEKFSDGLIETINHIKENLLSTTEEAPEQTENKSDIETKIANMSFEDLND